MAEPSDMIPHRPRGKGWVRDLHQVNVGLMRAAPTVQALPREVIHHKIAVASILTDQTVTASCVGQWIRVMAYAYLATRALPLSLASALAAYVAGRSWAMRGLARRPLLDLGCYPRDMVDAMSKWGLVREGVWPFDEGKVNEPLDLDVVQEMATHRVDRWRRIETAGRARIPELQRELAFGGLDGLGIAVGFGMDVDMQYERYRGGIFERSDDVSQGLHMQTLVGYSTLSSGAVVFHVANSWGKATFGEDGFSRIGERTIASPYCDDFYGASILPVLRKAA